MSATKTIKLLTSLFILLQATIFCLPTRAENIPEHPILFITSYNPETSKMATTLSAFTKEYKQLGGVHTPLIENLNCNNLPEINQWKGRMEAILNKYQGTSTPSLIVLLGQEAWATYLSLDSDIARNTPSICGMVSSNCILLPKEDVDVKTWEPETKSIYTDFKNHNIVGGFVYEYNIHKNIELIRSFYPQTCNIAFISDNTYGGLSMQSLMKQEMDKYPDLKVIWLDGRKETFMQVCKEITNMPKETCLLTGTWRVDSAESYIIDNTTYILREANAKLPTFTLASVGLGHWAIGGYVPIYSPIGKELGDIIYEYLDLGNKDNIKLERIPCHYVFDAEQLQAFNLEAIELPSGAELINKQPSFYDQYKFWLIGIASIFLALLLCLIFSIYHIIHTNKLKEDLETSGEKLKVAKEQAEEANRLKTTFLANMSHEIRTPLNAIVGFSDLITDEDITQEEKKQYNNIIHNNSELLLKLINDILDISRIESGKIKLEWTKCDLVELCQTVLTTVESTRRTSAEFRFETPVSSLMIRTDKQKLKQVLINLLMNAAKFTLSGSIVLSFAIKEDNTMVEISVTDTGCGIPESKHEKIFERFEKLNEFTQGTGLGLSISKLIVNKLGGKIWVDSNYKDGARLIFTHPLNYPPILEFEITKFVS